MKQRSTEGSPLPLPLAADFGLEESSGQESETSSWGTGWKVGGQP